MLVRAARFELMDRLIAGFFDDHFAARRQRGGSRIKGIEFQPTLQAVRANDFTKGN